MRIFDPAQLASRRRRNGMTQEALAHRAGISQVSISAIETGRKKPRLGTLERFALALGCEVENFFTERVAG